MVSKELVWTIAGPLEKDETNPGLGSGEEVGGELFNRHSLSLGKMKKFLKWIVVMFLHNKVMHYISQNCTVKNGENGKFMLCTFCHQKRK